MKTIKVKRRDIFGKTGYLPLNDAARALVTLKGPRIESFNQTDLDCLKLAGLTVEVSESNDELINAIVAKVERLSESDASAWLKGLELHRCPMCSKETIFKQGCSECIGKE